MEGFMFFSQLHTGSISDRQFQGVDFLIYFQERRTSTISDGDSIRADQGFDIEDDLQKIVLQLNIPPFLKEKPQFSESEVIKT